MINNEVEKKAGDILQELLETEKNIIHHLFYGIYISTRKQCFCKDIR